MRKKYEIDTSLFSLTGNVIFADFYQVRVLTEKINKKRNKENHISPGELNAAGLLDEIYHIAIKNYFRKLFPNAFLNVVQFAKDNLGSENFEKILLDFTEVFPPKDVYTNKKSAKEYLNDFSDGRSNKEILTEELILLYLENKNNAIQKLKELFDENYLNEKELYSKTVETIRTYFAKDDYKITVGNKVTDLFDFLSQPFTVEPNDIWKQLEFIKNEWGILIDEKLFQKILSSKDLFAESIVFNNEPFFGTAPTVVPSYKGKPINADNLVLGKSHFKYAEESAQEYDEPEQFTPDTNWMPNLVLIAKNIYVWLDQLSKKYQRKIKALDQIPIEELQQLKDWNINGLWLIGIWERSSASKKIKHLMGNTDAVASAYSLYDYQIAEDLGGEEAYQVFNNNAKLAGIRLASDMVPNHTGIYSKWILEHPDYFIQLDKPPFPSYSFTGPNLSEDSNIEIRIEDQYWEMKDAAVVFERLDLRTKETKYIYHGNDGTNMPWNDTAQLNLMKEEVREALIQKIFDVAKKFSVIRFDAAMTLAKKHYARLWFPQPGKGGDIPSRSDFAITRQQFDELFPKEFWREVVDRINDEMPETLLLAEAFWLMEGYFVRTLGMHRVYNSAFMNMMMKEENAKYRELITNTLEFEPEILKRYVNFMSNPDEETAIEQFGTDDKYFGVLILMCTLPGLPMFAHGQIEGFTEKYGMEYKRAYYNEDPKQWLVERHEREVFPVLKLRYLFSEVRNFWLFDFLNKSSKVNENVFVYFNQYKNQNGLVIFNNHYRPTTGKFLYSRLKLDGTTTDNNNLHNTTIAELLGIQNSDFHFYILKDITSGLEYIFNGKDIYNQGLLLKLKGYEYRVFINVQEIFDTSGIYYHYCKSNNGKGIKDINNDVKEIKLNPIHNSFKMVFTEKNIRQFFKIIKKKKYYKEKSDEVINKFSDGFENVLLTINEYYKFSLKTDQTKERFRYEIQNSFFVKNFIKKELKKSKIKSDKEIRKIFSKKLHKRTFLFIVIYLTVSNIKKLFDDKIKINSIADLRLTMPIREILSNYVKDEGEITRYILLINILLKYEKQFEKIKKVETGFARLRSQRKIYESLLKFNARLHVHFLNDEFVSTYIDVNEYKKKVYYSKEKFEDLIEIFFIYSNIKYSELIIKNGQLTVKEKNNYLRFVRKTNQLRKYLLKISIKSKYLFKDLQKNLGDIK
jgi:glycosidase